MHSRVIDALTYISLVNQTAPLDVLHHQHGEGRVRPLLHSLLGQCWTVGMTNESTARVIITSTQFTQIKAWSPQCGGVWSRDQCSVYHKVQDFVTTDAGCGVCCQPQWHSTVPSKLSLTFPSAGDVHIDNHIHNTSKFLGYTWWGGDRGVATNNRISHLYCVVA